MQSRTDAIVLRRVEYGESDLVVTLLTREHGKLSALARAARKSRKRFGAALGVVTLSQVELSRRPRAELWTLGSARLLRAFPGIAADVAALAHASYGTELVRELIAAEDDDPGVLDLAIELFDVIERRGPVPMTLRAFELSLLGLVGLAPVVDRCVACDVPASDAPRFDRGAVIDPSRGGLVCARCAGASRGLGVRPISAAALEVFAVAGKLPGLEAAPDLPPMEGMAEARDALLALVIQHIGKPLRSVEFIAKMSAGP